MSFDYSVNLTDVFAAYDPQDSLVSQAVNAALAGWSQYISGVGTLKVQVNVQFLGGTNVNTGVITLAEGEPTTYNYAGVNIGGHIVDQNSAVYELTTGQHLSSSDITLFVNSEALPTLASESYTDLVGVFEHEIAHGLGFAGFRTSLSSPLGIETAFDSHSVINGGLDYFTGAAAEYVNGGPVPLTTSQGAGSNFYHVGVGNGSDPASLSNDLLYWLYGTGRSISPLDVAILEDTGVPLSATGQAFIDPNPTSTIYEVYGNGLTPVVDAQVGGVTQPNELVTLLLNGQTLGTVQASAAGLWSYTPSVMPDGTYTITAQIASGAGPRTVATQTVVLDTTDPLNFTYTQVLGFGPDATALAADRQLLETGDPLQSIRNFLATSTTAVNGISAAYTAVLGILPPTATIIADETLLAQGQSLAGIRTYLAGTPQAFTAISSLYQSVLGQSADTGVITADETLLVQGQSLAGIRTYLASTGAAFTALNATYTAVLGQPITAAAINADEQLLASGQSLAGIRTYLSGTGAAFTALNAIYQNVLGQPIPTGVIGADEQLLAQGQSLAGIQTYLASTGAAFTALNTTYQAVLGQPIDASAINADEILLAQGQTLSAIRAYLTTTPQAVSALNGIYQSVLGTTADAPTIAIDQTLLAQGQTLAGIKTYLASTPQGLAASSRTFEGGDITTLVGTSYPTTGANSASAFVAATPQSAITPQTLAATPTLTYLLPNNDTLLAAQPETVTLAGTAATITGFNPATDILQLQSTQASSFSTLNLSQTNTATTLNLGAGALITLQGITETQLHPTNFRFA